MHAVKVMNTKLNKKVQNLEQEIHDKETEFNKEKMTMLRNHRKETDSLKKRHEKTLDRFNDKSLENEKQGKEIRRLKATIESLEKTIKELKNRLDEATGKDDKEDIMRLKEKILRLKEEKAEKKIEFEILKGSINVTYRS